MPRQARLDVPGILHHVMVRGLERCPIFRDDVDRRDFCTRWEGLVKATTLTVYAWALLPNHAHLQLRTGQRPLALCMRALLTRYAGAFNRLKVRPSAVYRATQRGRTARGRWERVLTVGETEKNIRKQRPL